MLFLEAWARPLLILHALSAAILVAASTHHLLWCRDYVKGKPGRRRQERRFALVSACAFVATFFLGNLLYPTYKVRVRAEYFDSPAAVAAETALRHDHAAGRDIGTVGATPAGDDLTWLGRLFDVKEHWVALGCGASLLLLLLSRVAHPGDDRRVLPAYLGLSAAVCATAWAGAIIGLVTASYRAVGGAS